MTRDIPGPLRAAAGLAAVAVDEARRLPNRLASLPVLAVGAAMQASMRAQQRYAELMGRGDQVLSHLREPDEQPPWARFDEDDPDGADTASASSAGDWAFAEDHLGGGLDELDVEPAEDGDADDLYAPDAAPATADPTTAPATTAPATTGAATGAATDSTPGAAAATGSADSTPGTAAGGAARTGKAAKGGKARGGDPKPKAKAAARTSKPARAKKGSGATQSGSAPANGTRTTPARADTAKTRAAQASAAPASAARGSAAPASAGQPGAAAGSAHLPLPNYDSLTLPQLRARIARLGGADLSVLLDHEREHAARPPYLTMLENRLSRVSAG